MKYKLKECLFYNTEGSNTLPLMDVYETTDFLVFEIDLPGVDLNDVSINVYDDIVVIEGIKSAEVRPQDCRYLCMERSFDSFRRMIKIPVKVNNSEGKAKYVDGVIRLTLPKVKDRVINIKIEKELD
ncbi:MAG: Hsp20/alpha crystallin family protein [Candidatus Magnetoovum sp. WYHC-5]|nr:Hsp20/alpha crystallin family protein [Candidatus Magnetoovum sp. WYHC-5]